MEIKVVLESAEEGGYTAYVPSLPGCISEGQTKKEALDNIREAIELYLEYTEKEEGKEIVEVSCLSAKITNGLWQGLS